MKNGILSILMISLLALTACQTSEMGEKETLGTLGGALAGGLLGAQIGNGSGQVWATGAGVLLGAFIGSEIGSSLDKADKAYMQQAQRRAMDAPVGSTISWDNPESGHGGSYTPVREGKTEYGYRCRKYEQRIFIDGQEETAYGTACEQPDGTWKLMNG